MWAKWFGGGGAQSPVADFTAFLARQAAFVAQKTVLDYCRVKSGRREAQLFADPDFHAALEHCRWQVYFAALSDVTALAEAWLRPAAPDPSGALGVALLRVHGQVLDGAPVPPEEAEAAEAARLALPGRLAALRMAPPLPADRLPLEAEAPLFATLPIAPEQRVGEQPAIRGALRFHIVATQQEMERRFRAPALAQALIAGA